MVPTLRFWLTAACLASALMGACGQTSRAILIRRQVPVPQAASREDHRPAVDIRYLLLRRGTDDAVVQAEAGQWRAALDIWEKSPHNDCVTLNNLGLAYRMTGDGQKAVETLSRALALCMDNAEVRWNYAAELALGGAPKPVYRRSEKEAEP